MTRQQAKHIDITRSYIPQNPNSFPDNLHQFTQDQDQTIPVMAYKGRNFLPTSYGYKSYFGTTRNVDISALAANVDDIFIFQNKLGRNVFIALCDTGIWYKHGAVSGSWIQAISLVSEVEDGIGREWTYTVMDDKLYCYRQNGDAYYIIQHLAASPYIDVETVEPNFLNMSAQQGIFKAGGRLGFWDSANSVSWSNLDDRADFVPSLETLAGSAIFSAVVGRIVTIKDHGDGFIIYATKSIIYVEPKPESLFLWDPQKILDSGIAYSKQVAVTNPSTTHYVYTSTGIYRVASAEPQVTAPEVYDYLKELAGPKYLKYLEGRYLFIQGLSEDYVDGIALYTDEPVEDIPIEFPDVGYEEYIEGLGSGDISFCAFAAAWDAGQFQPNFDNLI